MERLSKAESTILELIEDGLPLIARPYQALAEQADLSEAEVIEAVRGLTERGVIKRFGLVVRHHELGYRANAMVVWDVPDGEVAEVGRLMATFPFTGVLPINSTSLPSLRMETAGLPSMKCSE